MLLFRSISLKIIILVLANELSAQEEYGYDDSEDHSEYNEGDEHGHPDYSKYYSVDGPSASQSIPESGFTGSEFSGFFSPQPVEYAGTKQNEKILTVPPINFVAKVQPTQSLPYLLPIQQATTHNLKNFFDASQKNQISQDYIKPGPNYVSHALPLLNNFGEIKAASRDDVERIPPRPNKPKKDEEEAEEEEVEESDKDIDEEDEKVEDKNDKYGLDLLKNTKPFVNYNIGKSGSSFSQYPLATGLLGASPKLTPYQKYSFQPIVQASRVIPDDYLHRKPIKPYNSNYQKINLESQPTENVPSHLKDHDCRKIESGKSADMNCFVCTNAETKSKYTQCSYSSEKEPVDYYSGASERYSAPAKVGHFRYRRYAKKDRKVDPYYLIRERSRKTFEEPSIPEDYSSGYQYDPETYEDSPSELSYSEQQSEDIKKNPENCKKVEKDGSTCTVCRDPKTGGNYEQCSYSSQPQEKKYAYVKEKKYDSDDEPEETKIAPETKVAPERKETADLKVETSEPKADINLASKDFESLEKYEGQIEQKVRKPKKRNNNDPNNYENYENSRKKSEQRFLKDKYEIPNHFAESIVSESKSKSKDDSVKDFDEYHFKLFPELSNEESKQDDVNEEYQIPESTKQNVEEVLAEFTKKDRSKCKKSEKNGMTCFLCVDKNKIQHEECMFIQESKPQSSHVAYHELKGIKKLTNEEEPAEESKNKPVIEEDVSKNKPDLDEDTNETKIKPILLKFAIDDIPKKDALEVPNLVAAASEAFEEKIPYKQEKSNYRKKKSPKKYKKRPQQVPEPTLKTPAEFDVGDKEGAFSDETRPAQSKLHGVVLPKYMIEKSEYEKEFDTFSGAY